MTTLFKKLNYKDQNPVTILNAPEDFGEWSAMAPFTEVQTSLVADQKTDFILAFATKQAEVDALALDFQQYTEGDAVLWIAYPKGSSKRYHCEFNRDTGWEMLGKAAFEPVRQVAIDDDWSALRFRRVAFIKTMTRSFAMTEGGREKAVKPMAAIVPEDLRTALQSAPSAATYFEKLAPSHRKEYIRWIEGAKKTETRLNRIAKAIIMLEENKKIT
jgi:Bacteriocin-protection, YdeI or OmpD-Associated